MSYVTWTPLSRSKVKVTRLLTAAFTHKAGAAMTVRTYWAWETTATLRLLGGGRGGWTPTERRGAVAYRVATRTACGV